MNKQILILMLALLLIGNVMALNQTKMCKVEVDMKEATEQVTTTKQIPVMEDKIITTQIRVPVNVTYTIQTARNITTRTPINISYTATVPDRTKWTSDLNNYNKQVIAYKNLTDKTKATYPKYPVITYTTETRTKVNWTTQTKTNYTTQTINRINWTSETTSKIIQVQKTESKTKYYINWTSLKIETKTISVPLMETKTETTNQIKKGYTFNESIGKFYTMVKC